MATKSGEGRRCLDQSSREWAKAAWAQAGAPDPSGALASKQKPGPEGLRDEAPKAARARAARAAKGEAMAVVRRSVRVEEVRHIAESVAPRRLVEREAEGRGRRRRRRRRGRAGAAVCLRPRAVARVGRRRRRDLRLLKGATRREHDGGAEQQRQQREHRAVEPAEGGEESPARATLPPLEDDAKAGLARLAPVEVDARAREVQQGCAKQHQQTEEDA
mmetsp:Transcript_39529/g.127018  ORF Transcript_39529/g.127018 Transcript_39529/m.127018 type:complete len:218 (-) Transcript_39529:21-674(-)